MCTPPSRDSARVSHAGFAAPGLRLLAGVVLFSALPAQAQFLRIGPFDFTSKARLQGVFTTNVEGERPSQAKQEMEDYFIVVGDDLNAQTEIGPTTTLNLDTGISFEKHFNRPDLDNSSNPFGKVRLGSYSEFGRYRANGYLAYDRTSSSSDDKTYYIPGDRKTRDVKDTGGAGLDIQWLWRTFKVFGLAYGTMERHDDEQFKDGNKNEITLKYGAKWQTFEQVGLFYDNEYKKTEYTDKEAPTDAENRDDQWAMTERMGLDGSIRIIKKPKITYTLGLEKKTGQSESGKWKPTQTIGLDDDWLISSPYAALKLKLMVNYIYKKEYEEDDVKLTFGASADHEISPSARQVLAVTKEPVQTLGSKNKTDTTKFNYTFTKDDLFIYNLGLIAGAEYGIYEPLDPGMTQTEHRWTYNAALKYSRDITRRISRDLVYKYRYEKSDLNSDGIQEHRVTLTYYYTF